MPKADPARLRIAVVGIPGDDGDWASQLGGDDVDVVVVREVADLAGMGAQLGVVLASQEGMGLLKVLLGGKREWEKTFDSILDPIMVLDGKGRVIRANLPMARA